MNWDVAGWLILVAVALLAGGFRARRRQHQLTSELELVRIRIDVSGRILKISGPIADHLGFTPAQLLGEDVTRLMPAQIGQDHDGYVRRFAAALGEARGSSRVLGIRRLVHARHRDGSEVPFVLRASAMSVRGQRLFEGLLQPVPSQGVQPDQVQQDESAPSLDWRWLRNLGHEVRTPMAAIQGHAEILVDPRSGDDERNCSATAVLAACRHLLELLNDLLDHARLVAGERQMRPSAVNMRQLIADVSEIVRATAENKGLALEAEVDGEVPASHQLDSLALRQVLLNLLGNAIKFTNQGFVRIEAQVAGEQLRIDVADTGMGIGPDFAPALFEPFQQENRVTNCDEGSGLGLSICRQLTRQMGGNLTLVDSTPGVGTRFRLELPLGQPRVPREQPNEETEQADTFPLNGVRCLVVDDTRDLLRLSEASLVRAGALVHACSDGASALRTFDEAVGQFDVGLLDLMMPGMDGFELVKALRQRGFDGPLLALSAATDDATAAACRESDFVQLLTKPISRSDLVEAVRLTVGGNDRTQQVDDICPPASEDSASSRRTTVSVTVH